MSLWRQVVYNQNGTFTTTPWDRNQPVQGNGTYAVPRRFGGVASRIDLQSDAGSTAQIWNVKWFEPWRGSI